MAADHSAILAHHFEDIHQQRSSAELGMWLFLVTEIMFFGGVFFGYFAYRHWYPPEFAAASLTLSLPLGTINTAVLLTSSLTMALSVHAAQTGRNQKLTVYLLFTIVLGTVFLLIKFWEYYHKFHDHLVPIRGLTFVWPDAAQLLGAQAFFNLYFIMTGLHAAHMIIGIAVLLLLVRLAQSRRIHPESSLVSNVGLYWHFVDLIWVYLFPIFYLVAVRGAESGGH
jgi:cytochrome c oxidase subunit 3